MAGGLTVMVSRPKQNISPLLPALTVQSLETPADVIVSHKKEKLTKPQGDLGRGRLERSVPLPVQGLVHVTHPSTNTQMINWAHTYAKSATSSEPYTHR